jgi:hypothetical protein
MTGSRWRLGVGPWTSTQQVVDGVGWGYELERGRKRHAVTVIVRRHAFASAVEVATITRAAIQTKGRSEAGRIAQMDDPPRVVVLGRNGYLPAPTTLERVGA